MSPAPRPRPRPRAVTPPRRAETGSSLGSAGGPTATAPAPHAPYVHPTRFTAGENSRRAAQTRTPRARARTASRQAPDGPRVRLAPASEPGVPPRDDPVAARAARRAFHSGFALPPATRGGAPVVYLNVVLAAIRACVRLHGTLPRSIRPTSRTILDHSLLRCTGFSAVVFRHRIRTGCSLLEYVRDRFTTHP